MAYRSYSLLRVCRSDAMVLSSGLGGGVGVDDCAGQTGDRRREVLLGGHRHLVGLGQCEVGAQDEVAIGMQLVADPAQPQPADLDDAGTSARACSAWVSRAGSTASISRR